MNAITPFAREGQPPRRQRFFRTSRSDQEFLAPALEILETPASPVRLALIVAICGLVILSLAWAWFGQIDIIAVAAGKIEPSGKVKTVEPLITGRISEILVHDGDTVSAGEALVEFDATEVTSERDRLQDQQAALAADSLRMQTVLSALTGSSTWSSRFVEPAIDWSVISSELQSVEEGVLHRDTADLRAKLSSIESQLKERQADFDAVGRTIAAQERLIATLDTVASMRSALVDREAGTKANYLDAEQVLQTQQVTLATHAAQQADDAAALEVLQQEGQMTWTAFLADYAKTLNSTQLQLNDTTHKLAQARAQVELMTLHSPIDGVVQGSTLTSIGQVVPTGQEVLRVVPSDARIVVRAYLPNEDIGFVRPGQDATIKIAAFPFTQYGTLSGKIIAVGKDAVAGGTQAGSAGTSSPIADATGPLVYPVSIELPPGETRLNGVGVTLSDGMQVTAEINTGRRRILEYLFAPVIEVGTSALHER